MKITLVGIGMSGGATLTEAASAALLAADIVIGADRLLADLPASCLAEKIPQALPDKAAALVEEHPEWEGACIVLSGDPGFFSGAKRLVQLLAGHEVKVVPGLASPVYFAARLRRPWQDWRLASAHGVHCDIVAEVLNHRQTFFLTGGAVTPGGIIDTLCEAGLGGARAIVGENLSYRTEKIVSASAAELRGRDFAPLSVVLVENERTFARDSVVAGIPDEAFERAKAPMTKREIRAAALALLSPRPDALLYDIGAGTGSVAVEMALAARRGRVFAVERDAENCALIERNRERFGAYNLRIAPGAAPEALAALPPPDAVFVGGTGGAMRAILQAVLAKNAEARIVVSAIALESVAKAMEAFAELGVGNLEISQIAVSRAEAAGGLHLLKAQNPVFLLAGGGR